MGGAGHRAKVRSTSSKLIAESSKGEAGKLGGLEAGRQGTGGASWKSIDLEAHDGLKAQR